MCTIIDLAKAFPGEKFPAVRYIIAIIQHTKEQCCVQYKYAKVCIANGEHVYELLHI